MAQPISGINPHLLVWARERAGQTVEEVASAMHKSPKIIESWESGEAAPTYVQLEALAYKVYKRPVALFFFPEPPEEVDPKHEFRTLPGAEVEDLDADTRHKVREAQALQISLAELTNGHNPAQRHILRMLAASLGSPTRTAAAVRAFLGISLSTQTDIWKSTDEALKAWRAAIEDAGVFVFKDSFKQKDVSGFSLYDSEFPLVVINNSTAATRQIFTLFHELAHLLVHESGMTKKDDRYISSLTGDARRIEVFCNAFAAELLIPEAVVRSAVTRSGTADSVVSDLAAKFKISREVVLRRMLDFGMVTQRRYERMAAQWNDEYEASLKARKEKGGRGSYYNNVITYLSDCYARLAFTNYYRGSISVEQLANYLNVNVRSIPALEDLVLRKVSG